MEEQIDYGAKWTMVIESVSNNKKELTLTNTDCNAPVRKGNTFIFDNVGGKVLRTDELGAIKIVLYENRIECFGYVDGKFQRIAF